MISIPEFSEKIKNDMISCPYQSTCSGCQLLATDYYSQIQSKVDVLSSLLAKNNLTSAQPIEFLSAGSSGLRDRLDFSYQNGSLGLYAKNSSEIVDIDSCAQLSPNLQAWLDEVRQIRWPFSKGSIRLRVGPQGLRGIWLDLANIDIKNLLDEKNLILNLQKNAVVEIGQRRKIPYIQDDKLKLKDPELNIWFQTWIHEEPIDLYCHVASFTQPSLKANKVISSTISHWISKFPRSRIIEFGSGIGNLTLPALEMSESLLACEIDNLSLQSIETTLEHLPNKLQSLKEKLKLYRGDFQKKILQDFSSFDAILANPPRSGLMKFLDPLEKLDLKNRPEYFIYMSCFPESMMTDLVRLKSFGYEIQELKIVDQFPQTSHFEVLGLLQRNEF